MQSGNDVILTFSMPKEAVDRRTLKTAPSVEMYRGTAANNLQLLATIPGAMVTRYEQQHQVRYADTLTGADFQTLSGQSAVFAVRTFLAPERKSANSNLVTVQVVAPATPIADLSAEVTHSGVQLRWTAPSLDMSGQRVPAVGYRVYRAMEAETAKAPANSSAATPGRESGPIFARIAEVPSSAMEYLDTTAAAGSTYRYSVRSVLASAQRSIESEDSNVVTVSAHDTFAPTAPQNLVIALVPAADGAPAHLELSWQISAEADVQGYNVYRSDAADTPGAKQNMELLPTPAFRDMNVSPGRRYFYTVTAVDRSGNESAPSASAQGETGN